MAYITKKHVAISVLAVVLAGGLFALFEYKNKPKEFDVAKLLVENTSTNGGGITLSNKDSDSDGLLDWEEALWKTEINNPDTDGDGTVDGQEIKEGRDPAIAGPNDLIKDYSAEIMRNSSANQTDLLTQQFMVKYAQFLESGDPSEENKNKIIGEIVAELNNTKVTPINAYSESDLTVQKYTPENLYYYGDNLGLAIKKHISEDTGNELIILQELLNKKGDKKLLDTLAKISEEYRSLVNEFIRIETPDIVLREHLVIVNGLNIIANSVATFQKASTDPMSSLKELSTYGKVYDDIRTASDGIKKQFEKDGIYFKEGTGGYLFLLAFNPLAQ